VNYRGTIYVLINNKRRVFLELGEKRRAFDNVWKTNNNSHFQRLLPCHHPPFPTDIFLDVIGYLEGEPVVRECIPALPFSLSRMVHTVQSSNWKRSRLGILRTGEPRFSKYGIPHVSVYTSRSTVIKDWEVLMEFHSIIDSFVSGLLTGRSNPSLPGDTHLMRYGSGDFLGSHCVTAI
jgi:hypothetical protein